MQNIGQELIDAINHDTLDVVKNIVMKNIGNKDVLEYETENGFTPLMYACSRNFGAVKILIEDGKVNYNTLVGEMQRSAITEASSNGKLEAVKYLVDLDKSLIEQSNRVGFTPLYFAAMYYHLDLVKFLLESGADINQESVYGTTALFGACRSEREKLWTAQLKTIKCLLDHGANVHIKQRYRGDFPTLLHVQFRDMYRSKRPMNFEMSKMLIEAGVDVTTPCVEDGKIIFQLCTKPGTDIYNFIKQETLKVFRKRGKMDKVNAIENNKPIESEETMITILPLNKMTQKSPESRRNFRICWENMLKGASNGEIYQYLKFIHPSKVAFYFSNDVKAHFPRIIKSFLEHHELISSTSDDIDLHLEESLHELRLLDVLVHKEGIKRSIEVILLLHKGSLTKYLNLFRDSNHEEVTSRVKSIRNRFFKKEPQSSPTPELQPPKNESEYGCWLM